MFADLNVANVGSIFWAMGVADSSRDGHKYSRPLICSEKCGPNGKGIRYLWAHANEHTQIALKG